MKPSLLALLSGSAVVAQQIAQDPGVRGPPLEITHLYYDQMPTGIAVSRTGRLFSCYPSGLDANNTRYQVAELTTNNTETPYPNSGINSPPGGAINYTTYPPSGANYQNYFIGVQSVAIDPLERLWILDTGRALTPDGTLVPATFGGPKLVAIDLATNTRLSSFLPRLLIPTATSMTSVSTFARTLQLQAKVSPT